MADFNLRKLQVFVSSTFSDLIPERQAAVEAILTAGHIPAGMELFTSGDESQMEVIKHWIDESDVYLLILGGRYGSIERKTGKSYVQLEYEYAVSKGKPLFACVINEAAIEARVKAKGTCAIEMENPGNLKEFRAQVLAKICRFWEDTKDIKIAIAETLSHIARREGLPGWVRPAAQFNGAALADEIARLSKENAQLRSRLAESSSGETFNGLTFLELKALLERERLLDFLIKYRRHLTTGLAAVPTNREIKELVLRGLVEEKGHFRYFLSESACAFLNKLEALGSASGEHHVPTNGTSQPHQAA
jgi:hypothetical protein